MVKQTFGNVVGIFCCCKYLMFEVKCKNMMEHEEEEEEEELQQFQYKAWIPCHD